MALKMAASMSNWMNSAPVLSKSQTPINLRDTQQKPRAESYPAAPVSTSNYVHMSPSPMSDSKLLPSSNYMNHVI